MSVNFYQLVDKDENPLGGLRDTYSEAQDMAEFYAKRQEPVAIIEYQFEYSDSELVWTSTGDDTWPPERTNP